MRNIRKRENSFSNLIDEDLGDEDTKPGGGVGYEDLVHDRTYNLPEVLDLLKRFRKVLDEKTKEDEDKPR